jgi:predicted nucleic acid-binding protein
MILLDTDIIAEMMKPNPDLRVEAWLAAEPGPSLFITTITESELRHAAAMSSSSARREKFIAAIDAMLAEDFHGRVLPFDAAAAIAYAAIAAESQNAGETLVQFDAQIAAIAKSRGAALATRNPARFEGCGIETVNPWDDKLRVSSLRATGRARL